MNAGININKVTTDKGKTAFVFLLAILMLVVSCPFKRLLQTENNRQTSQRSVKWNGDERKAATYQNACGFAQKQKIMLVKIENRKQKLPAPKVFAEQNLQNGFSIHYFLSGSEKQYQPFTATSVSPRPLFLQYRRLLI